MAKKQEEKKGGAEKALPFPPKDKMLKSPPKAKSMGEPLP